MSRLLSERSIDHVVLERGEVANSWKTERWDSLRLLTPNWQCRLPGYAYDGDEPDGFMSVPEVIEFISATEGGRGSCSTTATTVSSVRRTSNVRAGTRSRRTKASGMRDGRARHGSVQRAQGARRCGSTAAVDHHAHADRVPQSRRLDDGGVLVVGASATGVQIAHEIQLSGRPVTLAVGEHVRRATRTYRGQDIHWWMELRACSTSAMTRSTTSSALRRVPSMQSVAHPNGRRSTSTLS